MFDQRTRDQEFLGRIPSRDLTLEDLNLGFWAYATPGTLLERARLAINDECDVSRWGDLVLSKFPSCPSYYVNECVNLYLVYTRRLEEGWDEAFSRESAFTTFFGDESGAFVGLSSDSPSDAFPPLNIGGGSDIIILHVDHLLPRQSA